MRPRGAIAGAALVLATVPGTATAQDLRPFPKAQNPVPADASRIAGGKRIRITYENLTPGQVFSVGTFFSHIAGLPPLFAEGKPANFGVMRIAEEGNVGPLTDEVALRIGGPYGSAVTPVNTPAGQTRTVELDVSAQYPMLTGLFMLVQTNDGFSGVAGVDGYRMTQPVTMDLYAWDAGTERNNELAPYLIIHAGVERDPETEPIRRHPGIRGDADLPPKWRFDPARPVARITFTPVSGS